MNKIIVILSLLLLVFIGIEITLYVSGQAPLTNRVDRAFSGAPEVHLLDQELLYHGTYELPASELQPHAVSKEGIQLFVRKELDEENKQQPTYLFVPVPGDERHVFRYSVPKGIGY